MSRLRRQEQPMALDRKLAEWVAADLIDGKTAERIRAHEHASGRPVLLWAIAALGLLAVVLGIILMISANWDRIPASAKLTIHFALLLAAAAACWRAFSESRLWEGEAALFIFSALILGGIALQSQVYQLVGPSWQALLLWIILAGPAMLLGGKTRLIGTTFSLGMVVALTAMATSTNSKDILWLLAQGLAMAAPAVLVLLSFLGRYFSPPMCLTMRQTGVGITLIGTSLAHFAWADAINPSQAFEMAIRLIPAICATAGALWLAWRPQKQARGQARVQTRTLPRPLALALLLGPLLALSLTIAIPHAEGVLSRAIGVFVYGTMWAAIAWAATHAARNILFALAIGAIAVRIFIIYIELFGSLAKTGLMLFAGGILLVALAWGWRALVRVAAVDDTDVES